MLDQAFKLRELAEKSISVDCKKENFKTKIITVASGKGGVGKSNIVVNLSMALQNIGRKVLIFDADIGMANDDLLMGIISKYNIYDVISKNIDIEEAIVEGPLNVKLLSGGSALAKVDELTELERVNFFKKIENLIDYDYIIIDTGAGINRSILAFIACSDEFILVTTPEPTSLTDGYSLIKAINHFHIKDTGSIIVNRVLNFKEGETTFRRLNNCAIKFLGMNLNFLGVVKEDLKLSKSVRTGIPFYVSYPECDASNNIKDIVSKLEGLPLVKHEKGVQNLFKKIFGIFS